MSRPFHTEDPGNPSKSDSDDSKSYQITVAESDKVTGPYGIEELPSQPIGHRYLITAVVPELSDKNPLLCGK